MALEKRIGFGCKLGVDTSGGSSYDEIGSVVDGWTGPSAAADEVDTTILSDTWKTFMKASIDPGSVSFQIAYDPNDTDCQGINSLLASTSTTLATWQVTFPDVGSGTDTETFTGFVTSLDREVSKTGLVMATIGIKISGNPGFATS